MLCSKCATTFLVEKLTELNDSTEWSYVSIPRITNLSEIVEGHTTKVGQHITKLSNSYT